MRVVGYAYPWDVVAPGFVDRARELGVDAVAVALSYHSTRAATPWSRETSTVLAPTAALYRPVRDAGWGSLRPAAASWLPSEDPGADAVAVLNAADIPALGWIVLTHNSFLGVANPELSVMNCLGEQYPWALCPSNPETIRYCATLATEATRGLNLAGTVLEAAGQMGAVHQCQHEKTDGAWSPAVARLLSVCCCEHCAVRWSADPDEVRMALRGTVFRLIAGGESSSATPEELLPGDLATRILAGRHAATDELRRAIQEGLGEGHVTVHASPDPWATGALPGLTPATGQDVDAVVTPCWTPIDTSERTVREARAQLPANVSVGAYVTGVAATPRPELPSDAARLAAAGADELHLYHLGLAGPARWPHLQAAATAAHSAD
ncbi:hypothetical protein EFY87_17930 [Flexivirga caeni]|uniref:Alanine-rich protein n=2 Tax=Flexivirga caeni TaxID=2294115 RepID=A0A3M9M107_9MICO|nr:hypothetical protein EFY87_17930 [Flexivirga caeni]